MPLHLSLYLFTLFIPLSLSYTSSWCPFVAAFETSFLLLLLESIATHYGNGDGEVLQAWTDMTQRECKNED